MLLDLVRDYLAKCYIQAIEESSVVLKQKQRSREAGKQHPRAAKQGRSDITFWHKSFTGTSNMEAAIAQVEFRHGPPDQKEGADNDDAVGDGAVQAAGSQGQKGAQGVKPPKGAVQKGGKGGGKKRTAGSQQEKSVGEEVPGGSAQQQVPGGSPTVPGGGGDGAAHDDE